MINGDGNENSKKPEKTNKTKTKSLGDAVHYFCTFLSLRQHETSYLHVLWRKYCRCSSSLFFTAAQWWQLAFLIFSPPLWNFYVLLQRNSSNKWNDMCGEKNTEKNSEFQMGTQTVCLVFCFFVFLSLYLSLSLVIHVSIDIYNI